MNGKLKDQPEDWRIATNDRYIKIVASVISLATGTLVLPVLFLREFLGVRQGQPLLPLLNWRAVVGWFCLGLSIFCGLAYSWLSVKWVKLAWGLEIKNLPESRLNWLLDVLFVGMAILFLAGVISLVCFFVHSA